MIFGLGVGQHWAMCNRCNTGLHPKHLCLKKSKVAAVYIFGHLHYHQTTYSLLEDVCYVRYDGLVFTGLSFQDYLAFNYSLCTCTHHGCLLVYPASVWCIRIEDYMLAGCNLHMNCRGEYSPLSHCPSDFVETSPGVFLCFRRRIHQSSARQDLRACQTECWLHAHQTNDSKDLCFSLTWWNGYNSAHYCHQMHVKFPLNFTSFTK